MTWYIRNSVADTFLSYFLKVSVNIDWVNKLPQYRFKFEPFSDFKSHSNDLFDKIKLLKLKDISWKNKFNLCVILLSGCILDKLKKLFTFNYAVQSYERCPCKCYAGWISEMSLLLILLKLYQKQID